MFVYLAVYPSPLMILMLFQVTIVENGRHMAVEMDTLTTLVENLHVEFNKTQAITNRMMVRELIIKGN